MNRYVLKVGDEVRRLYSEGYIDESRITLDLGDVASVLDHVKRLEIELRSLKDKLDAIREVQSCVIGGANEHLKG
jgi:hypothetical protein